MKGEIRVKQGGDLVFFWVSLGISHPTHPYLGKFSQKNGLIFWGLPLFVWWNLVTCLGKPLKEDAIKGSPSADQTILDCQDCCQTWSWGVVKRKKKGHYAQATYRSKFWWRWKIWIYTGRPLSHPREPGSHRGHSLALAWCPANKLSTFPM